ncbi:MAG: hypothetical protein LBU25_11745 [Treponema sp.]|jgi:hypothetical protein|nr:hypothetical protein [Treponema sp.]
MTLPERNTLFKGEIGIAFLILIGVGIAACSIMPVYPAVLAAIARRSSGMFQSLGAYFLEPNPYVPFVSMLCAMLYGCITMVIIYRYFEKTYSPEILYIALFVLSFALEGSRIMVPLKLKYELPGVYLIMASRVLLFGRYLGILSLFVASVCAAGLEVQKQHIMIGIIIFSTLMITRGVPIDGLSWDSSFCMISGYPAMFRILEGGMALITVVSFFISAYSRGAKEYIFIGIGSLLVMAGRNMLLGADTWISPFPGLGILCIGTWVICTYLHRVYLWL